MNQHSQINKERHYKHTGGSKKIYNVTIPKGEQLKIFDKEKKYCHESICNHYQSKCNKLSLSSSSASSSSSSSSSSNKVSIPKTVDLRSKFPAVFDQGPLGSCSSQAFCALVSYDISNFIGSRLFLYYNERSLENDIPDDCGAMLVDGVNALRSYGICLESQWGYYISKFAVRPPVQCYKEAKKHLATKYAMLPNDVNTLKTSLASGIPFVIGIAVFDSFESEQVSLNGMVPMPGEGEELLGGHAVCVVGYADSLNCFLVRNSWGKDWAIGGYFWLPYSYVASTDLCSEIWCVSKF